MHGSVAARAAPLAILVGYLVRPYVGDYTDAADVADAAAGAPGRWVLSSLLVALGFAGVAVAVTWAASAAATVRRSRATTIAPVATTFGAVLLALQLGAVAASTASAAEVGVDGAVLFDEVGTWEGPLIGAVLVAMAVGLLSLAHALRTTGVLGRTTGRAFTIATAVAVIGLLVPSSIGEYVTAAALVVGFWMLASAASLGARPRADETVPA